MEPFEKVTEAVKASLAKYGRLDAKRLAEGMGILLNPVNFGKATESIKGFIVEYSRIKCITYNDDLDPEVKEAVIMHEIGHAVLHSPIGVQGYTDTALYDESSRKEKEANLFAAEYMLPDNEVIDALNGDATFFTAAESLGVPAQLLDFKFRLLKWKGYKFNESPIYGNNKFLRDI